MANFKTSPNGRSFIESNEGLTLTPKPDAKGKDEIGYGHDILPGEDFSAGITKAEADLLLSDDLTEREAFLNQHVDPTCTQNQFDALMDFCYEEGEAGTLTLLSHGWSQIPAQILRWDIVEGQPNEGVENRRKRDLALFQMQSEAA